MWRLALFISVLSGGALIFETIGLLVRDEAWLVAGVIVALLFCIPESERGDPKDLIFSLVSVIGFMAYFKVPAVAGRPSQSKSRCRSECSSRSHLCGCPIIASRNQAGPSHKN